MIFDLPSSMVSSTGGSGTKGVSSITDLGCPGSRPDCRGTRKSTNSAIAENFYQYGQSGLLLEETDAAGVAQADYIYLDLARAKRIP
jgi:hypothetical protein